PTATTLSNDVFFDNAAPLTINAGIVVDTSNVFYRGVQGNTENAILLAQGTNLFSGTMVMAVREVPYIMHDQFTIQAGATLVVRPGVTIAASSKAAQLYLNGGNLDVAGTAAHPVVMTARGEWQGIFVNGNAHIHAAYLHVFSAGTAGGLHINDPAVVTLDHIE